MNAKAFLFASVAAIPMLGHANPYESPPATAPSRGAETRSHDYPMTANNAYHGTYAMGREWLPDKGIMLTPMRRDEKFMDDTSFVEPLGKTGAIDNRRTLPWKVHDKACITLKLQKDYSSTDDKAEPAAINWTKDAGESGDRDIDAALRADFWLPKLYNPEGAEMSFAVGYELRRLETDTPSEEIDQQAFHISIPFVPKQLFSGISFLDLSKADQVFQADVTYLDDNVSGDSGFDFETDWKPVFKLPFFTQGGSSAKGMWMGVRCGIEDYEPLETGAPPDKLYYLIDPKIGLSYGDRYSLGSPIANLNSEVVASYSLGVKIGGPISWGPEQSANRAALVEFGYTFKGGTVVSDNGSFVHHVVGLHIKPSQGYNQVSFDITYENGKDGFAKKSKVEQVSVGLGVRF